MSLTTTITSSGPGGTLGPSGINNAGMPLPFQALVAVDQRTDTLAGEVGQLFEAVRQTQELLRASDARNALLSTQMREFQTKLNASEEARRQEKRLADEKISTLQKQLDAQVQTSKALAQKIQDMPGPYVPPSMPFLRAPLGR